MSRLALALGLSSLLLALANPAFADDPVAKARILFNAGAQAYGEGRFADAVVALRDAHQLTPDRPTVLFSLAQAERRQYTVSGERSLLKAAIEHFRRYLELVPEGGRRADAVEALGELVAIAARLGDESADPQTAANPTSATSAHLTITTTTVGAEITLDGGAAQKSPVVATVTPGLHVVRITAPGYLDEQREIRVVEGVLVPLEIEMRERPSYLALGAPEGSTIFLDGKKYGESEGPTQIQLPPGVHAVALTQRGRVPYFSRVSIERGQTSTLDAPLKMSTQRYVSLSLFGGATLAALIGAGLSIGAISAQNVALSVQKDAAARNITRAELDQYNSARDSRDNNAGAAAACFGVASLLVLGGGALYYFDLPAPLRSAPEDRLGIQRGRVGFFPGGAGLVFEGAF